MVSSSGAKLIFLGVPLVGVGGAIIGAIRLFYQLINRHPWVFVCAHELVPGTVCLWDEWLISLSLQPGQVRPALHNLIRSIGSLLFFLLVAGPRPSLKPLQRLNGLAVAGLVLGE